MPVTDDIVVTINAYIVEVEIPFLLGLDVLRQLQLILNFDDGTLRSARDYWRMSLVFTIENLYAEWLFAIYYTESELRKIHNHFSHSSADELLQLMHQVLRSTPHSSSRNNRIVFLPIVILADDEQAVSTVF